MPLICKGPVKFPHHKLEIELPDDWWSEAGMAGFIAASRAYRANQNCLEISIRDIGPVLRNEGSGIFNDSPEEGSARERVIRILCGFRSDSAIPPVEVVKGRAGYPYRYKLTHGAHRLYCSLAAGFTHIPWIKGFDVHTLDQ